MSLNSTRALRFPRNWTLDTKALLVAEAIMAALCAYRFYSYVTTGFFVSDEFGYYYNAVNGGVYGDRWFFGWMNIVLFDIFSVKSPDSFAYFLPFFLFFWAGLTLLVFHKLLRVLGFDRTTTALSLIASFALISFVVLSLGFLTEGAGLCLAMIGVYGILKFWKATAWQGRLLWPAVSSLCLGFAGGTREPYVALELGGLAILVILAISQSRSPATNAAGKKGVAAGSVLVAVSLGVLLLYANSATSSVVVPLTTRLIQDLFSNPSTLPITTVSVTTNQSTFATASTIVSQVSQVSQVPSPFYGRSLPLNALVIFVGGIVLGWGPVAFPIALVGFVMLLRKSLRKDTSAIVLTTVAVCSLGSYLVVSFFFAPDPNYFTFRNYSTIIRFSGTALPAFFVTAPTFLALVAKNRRRITGLLLIGLAFVVLLVPAYQSYAISNLGYTTVNPFGLNYRSPAVLVRDYFRALPTGSQVEVAGVPYGWYFTPGIGGLTNVNVYSLSPNDPLSPLLNYSSFIAHRWTDFYVLSSTSFSSEEAVAPFVLQFVPGAPQYDTNTTAPYTITNSQIVIQNPDFLLVRVSLSWP